MVKRSREDSPPLVSASSDFRPLDTTPALLVTYGATSPKLQDSSKIPHLDTEGGETSDPEVMRCSLPPHQETLSFASFEAYEVHYSQMHVNRCLECRRNFPTEHFLNLHIEENHDSLVAARRERGERTVGQGFLYYLLFLCHPIDIANVILSITSFTLILIYSS